MREDIPADFVVTGNTNLMVQVLVNLLKNAIDATSTKRYEHGEVPTVWINAERKEGTILLKVRDNGTGIEEKHLGKIFDPFFSTKDQGQGMGLGLSLCYRIIQSFGGTISVKTQVGEFAEFLIELPAEVEKAQTHESVLQL